MQQCRAVVEPCRINMPRARSCLSGLDGASASVPVIGLEFRTTSGDDLVVQACLQPANESDHRLPVSHHWPALELVCLNKFDMATAKDTVNTHGATGM
jgi:hypothetical protein